jgi:hypothetical protein
MNILQEIDSTLHYENLEKAWHKYKFLFIFGIIALFAGLALFNKYNSTLIADSKHDTSIIFNVMAQNSQSESKTDNLVLALDKVITTQGKENLKFELAKSYKNDGNEADYEKTLLELTNAKTSAIKNLSIYMLAETYLAQDAKKALDFINNAHVNKKAFTYSLIQEVKAVALTNLDKKDEATAIYAKIVSETNTPADQKNRVQIKLNQLTAKNTK